MAYKICAYCGKACTSFSVEIAPDDSIPEIKKKLRFCSDACANRFLGTIKSSRKKKANKELRAQLEHQTRPCADEDILQILNTLTVGEKQHLLVLGTLVFLSRVENRASWFYQKLHKDMKDAGAIKKLIRIHRYKRNGLSG